jgi:hypothetical protein
MGSKIYTLCNGGDTAKDSEIKSITNILGAGKPEENKQENLSARAAPALNLPFKVLGDLSEEDKIFVKEFDENIIHHGNWIPPTEMTQYINANVQEVESTIGPYEIPKEDSKKHQGAFETGPFLFKDKTIYSGQWSLSGKKHGYGVYIKPDGSKYQGLWSNDKIEGVGRYIDKNGNFYEGNN